jgi:hypothetical protein
LLRKGGNLVFESKLLLVNRLILFVSTQEVDNKRVYDVLMEPLFLETQKVFDDYQRYIGAIKKLVVFKEQPTRRFRTPFPSLLRRSGTLATQSLFPMVIMYLLLQRVSLLSFRRSCWSCGESNILQGMSRHTSISTCASQRPSEYA